MKAFANGWNRHVLLFALLFILTSCQIIPLDAPATIPGTPPPFPCAYLSDSRWQEFDFGVDFSDDTVATVVRLWEIDSEQFAPFKTGNGLSLLSWTDVQNEAFYTALFRKKELQKFTIEFHMPPTLAQVLDCLGPPEYYAAYEAVNIEKYRFNLELWYQERGLVIDHTSFYTYVSPTADLPAQRMDGFYVVAPEGTLEQMVQNVYPTGDLDAVQTWVLCTLRPWPNSIKSIAIESFHGEERRCREP